MTTGEKQRLFTFLIAGLIQKAYELGFEVSFGEVWRSPEECTRRNLIREAAGKPKVNSLHKDRLAADLNLFKDGEYLRSTEDHRELGEWWEDQHELCSWGGHFNDGNHYSVTHAGRK